MDCTLTAAAIDATWWNQLWYNKWEGALTQPDQHLQHEKKDQAGSDQERLEGLQSTLNDYTKQAVEENIAEAVTPIASETKVAKEGLERATRTLEAKAHERAEWR